MENNDKTWGGKREGAGRKALPEGQKRVNMVVKIKPAIVARLREIAAEHKKSVSSIVEDILENSI
jgi:hypothetical protein